MNWQVLFISHFLEQRVEGENVCVRHFRELRELTYKATQARVLGGVPRLYFNVLNTHLSKFSIS